MSTAKQPVPYHAFFDVDGTLINTRSLVNFLDYYCKEKGIFTKERRAFYRQLYIRITAGESRYSLNRFYYTFFRGHSEQDIISMSRDWFFAMDKSSHFYNTPMLHEVERHLAVGARIVLVSGSLHPILTLLKDKIDASFVICSKLHVVDGICTGELETEPCIGPHKAHAILEFASNEKINLNRCFAYGDDESDEDMLNAVGNPVQVVHSPVYEREFQTYISHIRTMATSP